MTSLQNARVLELQAGFCTFPNRVRVSGLEGPLPWQFQSLRD